MKKILFLIFLSALMGCHRTESKHDSGARPSEELCVLARGDSWLNTSRPLKAEDLSGRILLIDFWTYCCINCMHVIPDLKKLEQDFGKDLTVVGVHSGKYDNEHDVENIRSAVLRYGLEHPVVNDADFKIWNAFGVNSWPTLILINPEGEVDRVYSGEGHYQDLHDDILRLQKKYAGKVRGDSLPLALEKDKTPSSLLSFPGKLAYAPDLERIFVSDSGHNRILSFDREGHVLSVIGSGTAGWRDGGFAEAQFRAPQGLAYAAGKLYVADTENHLLRLVDLEKGQVSTLAGTGKQGFEREPHAAPAAITALSSPWDLAFFPDANSLVIAMAGTHQLWSYDLNAKTLQVLAGSGLESLEDGAYPDNALSQPSGLSAWDHKLYFVDSETSSLRILAFQPEGKVLSPQVKTLIGAGLFDFGLRDGGKDIARMQHPLGVWAEASSVYVADTYNHVIRRYDAEKARLSTFAGDGRRGKEDGDFAKARFNEPNALVRVGDKFFVADTNNHAIRVLDPATHTVTTLSLSLPGTPVAVKPSEKLPNLKIDGKLVLSPGAPIALTLKFPEGWKLNAQAPSVLRLFQKQAGEFSLAKSYGKDELSQGHVVLPSLENGWDYLLQGTLYYCREGKDALCFLMGAQESIQIEKGGATMIEWTIGGS